jgi:hypothetical protein
MQHLFRLLIFLNQPYTFRATNLPILRSTFWLYIQLWYDAPTLLLTGAMVEMELFHLNRGTSRQQCRCTVPKAVYRVKKWSWGWANLLPETCRVDVKILMNEKVVASCYLLIWLYCSGIHCRSCAVFDVSCKHTSTLLHKELTKMSALLTLQKENSSKFDIAITSSNSPYHCCYLGVPVVVWLRLGLCNSFGLYYANWSSR